MNTTWRQCTIGDVCDTISNTYNSNAQQVVLINTSDVLEGKVLNHIYIPNENLKGQFKKTFEEGDILYSEIRPQNKRYAYIDFAPINYIASTKLMVIRNKNIVKSKYLYYFLQSDKIISELQMLAETRSGTFPQITFNELSKLSIKIPPLPEQDRIISILDSICKKIDINQQINERLIRQSGAFLLSGSINIQLNKSDYGVSRIEKSSCSLNSQFASERIIIPAGSKESLLEELNFYNINQGALFPELEHQMAYIKYSMCKSNVRSASSFEKIDFDAIKAEESKEGVEIAESVVKEELVDKAIYDIVSQYISDDAIKQNVLRIITRQTEYIDWANKEATISDLRRKIKRSLSLQSISSDVATQSARNMVSQLVNLYVKK